MTRARLVGFCLALSLMVPSIAFAGETSECVKSSERGISARDAGKLREARKQFVTCAADTCQKALRIDCARWLEEVDASLPTVVFGAKDGRGADLFEVTVTVDGEPVTGHEAGKAIAFDPGPHVVRFERDSGKVVEEKVLLRVGEHNRPIIARFDFDRGPTRATAPPAPPPKQEQASIPTASIVLGGVGLAALGSFTYFAISGSSEKSDLRARCGSRCSDAEVASLKTRYILADVSLGVGIVALGVATYLWLTHGK